MDEPSTGLDPASRSNLWNVVKRAKQDRAIILTSMFPPLSLTVRAFACMLCTWDTFSDVTVASFLACALGCAYANMRRETEISLGLLAIHSIALVIPSLMKK